MNLKQTVCGVVLAAAAASLTGCGPGSETSGPVPETPLTSAASTVQSSAPAAAEEAVITIRDFQYEVPESVAPGATVTVINEDAAPHTVTAESEESFDAIAAGGKTVTFTAPEEPGEYSIICTYHPQMSATLVVQ